MVGKKEQLIKVSKGTQFKKGNKAAAGSPGQETYRQAMEWIRNQDIDASNIDASLEKLRKMRAYKNEHPMNTARLVAIRAVERLLKKMEPHMLNTVINQTEGMLQQDIGIAAPLGNAPTEFATDAEAEAAYLKHIKQ